MNTSPGGRRRYVVIAAVTTAALVGGAIVLVIVLRSSLSHKTAPAEPQQALAYAQCMRANGLPDFPDPGPDGRIRGLSHEQRDNPKFRTAETACRALAPGGEHEKSADPAAVEQMRQFSQCMRDHGLPDFPDPEANGQLRGAGHEQQDNPQYSAAYAACRPKLPGGGHQ